jgi:hypothetical protein
MSLDPSVACSTKRSIAGSVQGRYRIGLRHEPHAYDNDNDNDNDNELPPQARELASFRIRSACRKASGVLGNGARIRFTDSASSLIGGEEGSEHELAKGQGVQQGDSP